MFDNDMNMWDEYDDGEDNDNEADLKSKNLVLQRKIKELQASALFWILCGCGCQWQK
jgi:hypothetical protein